MSEFPFELDDFQKEACNYIDEGKSVVVCAPTGAGKTVIAQHAIHRALENGNRIFYTTPLKALSNQKYYDFGEKYGTEKVGLLTGDTSINRNAQIVVMTTEVFRNMLYGTNFGSVTDNMKDVKYVVLDEVHYMNDEQRGHSHNSYKFLQHTFHFHPFLPDLMVYPVKQFVVVLYLA